MEQMISLNRARAMLRWRPTELGSSILRASIGTSLLRVAGLGVTFLLGVQLARYLGPAQFGVYGVVMAISAILLVFGQWGLNVLPTREIAAAAAHEDWPRTRGVLQWAWRVTLVRSSIVVVLASAALVFWPGSVNDSFRKAAAWGLLLVPLQATVAVASAQLRGFHCTVQGQAVDALIRPALLSAILFFINMTKNSGISAVQALELSCIASAITILPALWWLYRALPNVLQYVRPVMNSREWNQSVNRIVTLDFLRVLEGNYAVLLVGLLTTPAETGLFRVASSSVILVSLPMTILSLALAPIISRLHALEEFDKLQRLLTLSAAAMTLCAASTVAGIAVAGHWLIQLAFGARYGNVFPTLLLLSLAQSVTGLFGVGNIYLIMVRAEAVVARAYACSITVGIAAALILGPRLGAEGVAYAAILGAIVNNLVLEWGARKLGMSITVARLARWSFLSFFKKGAV